MTENHIFNRVVLGVTGSVAAFKGAMVASALVQSHYKVRVVLTSGGARFVAPLTFEAITGYPVHESTWTEQTTPSPMGHLELARWANAIVVAPASANTLARLSLGLADDMLGALILASTVPLVLAPAMETNMWHNSATQEHVSRLRQRGASFVGPDAGYLASGASGEGRMAQPEEVVRGLLSFLVARTDLAGHRVLVTAGPTLEPIDPVRFIGNRSSGKMGYAIAEEARDRGGDVLLIAGPTALPDPHGINVVHVETAAQMEHAVLASIADCRVAIMAAAVSDFTTADPALEKTKRCDRLSIDLVPTVDIAAAASHAAPKTLHIGFALETSNAVVSAREKLTRKGQRMVVVNEVTSSHSPFGSDMNSVSLVFTDRVVPLPAMSKRDVARRILDEVILLLQENR